MMTEQIIAPAEVFSPPPPPLTSKPAKAKSKSPPKSKGAKGLALPELEPWHDPVEGAELLDQLVAAFERFVSLPPGAPQALALWVVFTHTFDAWESSPRLALTSPVPGCGKTTVLSLLGQLVRRPLPTSNVTSAVVFRAIEQWQPTLLIDEADSFLADNDQLRGILNSGHARHMAYVLRSVAATTSRAGSRPGRRWQWPDRQAPSDARGSSNRNPNAPRLPDEQIERFRRAHEAEFRVFAQKAARWAQDHIEELAEADPAMPEGLCNRAADNWRPLMGIANAAGGDWSQHAILSICALTGEDAGEASPGSSSGRHARDLR